MTRAAKLDVNLYEEVEADTTANGQAFLAVVIVSLATGIGAGITGLAIKGGLWFIWGLLTGLVASLVGWLAWSFFAYKLFPGIGAFVIYYRWHHMYRRGNTIIAIL